VTAPTIDRPATATETVAAAVSVLGIAPAIAQAAVDAARQAPVTTEQRDAVARIIRRGGRR
jgi:hypothetical protein